MISLETFPWYNKTSLLIELVNVQKISIQDIVIVYLLPQPHKTVNSRFLK